jgi:hypothetical protein
MWTYQQSTGQLRKDGALVGTGYSGHGDGVNNPAAQNEQRIGPIPQGVYRIGAPLDPPDHLGPLAMPLTAQPGTETFGRSAFFMHGDNSQGNESASEGCIIMARLIRQTVAASPDRDLTVVA